MSQPPRPQGGQPLHTAPKIATDLLEGPGIQGFDHLTPDIPPDDVIEFADLTDMTGGGLPQRYDITGLLDEGGMGKIHTAKDQLLRRGVVIKELKRDQTSRHEVRAFIKEVQVTAQLDHPNIVPIYNVMDPRASGGAFAFSMKFIQGRTLDKICAQQRDKLAGMSAKAASQHEHTNDLRERLEQFERVCEALRYAHSRHVVHRDLKPANIMVGAFGQVYVMDWGIAYSRSLPLTEEPGKVLGTPGYMAPEQLQGGEPTALTDIYALGAILFELITLTPAFPIEGDFKELIKRNAHGKHEPFNHAIKGINIHPDLAAIVHTTLAYDPQHRYQSVDALADDLGRYLRAEEVSVRPDNAVRKLARWMNEHRVTSLVILLVILALSSSIAIWSLATAYQTAEKSRARTAQLSAFQAGVTERAHRIDAQFMHVRSQALSLAEHAQHLLATKDPGTDQVTLFSDTDFGDASKQPKDTFKVQRYGKPVSLDHPVYKLAPSVDKDLALPQLRRLSDLRHHFPLMLIRSVENAGQINDDLNIRASTAGVQADRDAIRARILRGVPILWTFIGLESGVMYAYPGKGGYSPNYDPRKRPWYELGKRSDSPQWGKLYNDAQGLGLLMPVVAPIYDRIGQFQGVAAVEMTLGYIIDTYLKSSGDKDGFIESYLLDGQGKVIIRSSELGQENQDTSNSFVERDPFRDPALIEAINNQPLGVIESTRDGQRTLIGYQMLTSLGWTYAEEDTAESVLP